MVLAALVWTEAVESILDSNRTGLSTQAHAPKITTIQLLQYLFPTVRLTAHFCVILESGLDPSRTAANRIKSKIWQLKFV
jgi:hypothetical protein